MTTEEKQLINRLRWALHRIEKEAYSRESLGLYSAGMRDARKTLETAFFCELDEVCYFDN